MTDKSLYPLYHDWPVRERLKSFEQGCVIECTGSQLPELAATQLLGRNSAGWWECDLSDNSLVWTSGVYGIFGLPHGSSITREETLALYSEDSRAKLERLRTWAISNSRGFVLDVEIRPANGEPERIMRIIACPVLEDGSVQRLQGLKVLI